MRLRYGGQGREARKRKREWHSWFAWFPVVATHGGKPYEEDSFWAWLERMERRLEDDYDFERYSYRDRVAGTERGKVANGNEGKG